MIDPDNDAIDREPESVKPLPKRIKDTLAGKERGVIEGGETI